MTPTVHEALRDFYSANEDELYTYAVSITRHRESAEDAIHQAFQRLLRRDSLPADLRPYLFRCVRNAALDGFRRKPPGTDSIFRPAAEATTPDRPPVSIAELDQWLRTLSDDERETITLKVYDDFSFRDIAALRGVSINTASSWYRRGLTKLRELWIEETT